MIDIDYEKIVGGRNSVSEKSMPREIEMCIKKVDCIFTTSIHYHKNFLEIIYTDINKFDMSRLFRENIEPIYGISCGDGSKVFKKAKFVKWLRVDSDLSKLTFYFDKCDIGKHKTYSQIFSVKVHENDDPTDLFMRYEKTAIRTLPKRKRRKEHVDKFTFEFYMNILLHGLNKYTLDEVIISRLENNKNE